MQCKERLEAYLREHQMPFQVQQHARTFSAQKMAESEHIPGKMVAKTVIAWADNQMIALVLPASYRADLNKVGNLLGTKEIRLAHEAEFAATFPDCAVGTMPPFGNLYGIPVYVEKRLAELEKIVFPVGTYTETMSLRYADFERLVHPRVIAFAHIP
jgi:Ala-tRNA(Pro) deacylase